MRANGIAYDTGFLKNGATSWADFDADVVRRELTIIRDDLHCTAVQLVGGVPERLETAGRLAAELGLEVWFSPYPLDLTVDELHELFADCAERAERIRRTGAEVVFVAGAELSVMVRGFADGATLEQRLGWLLGSPADRPARPAKASERLNDFFREAVTSIRKTFGGKVTYAAIQFEGIDWDLFDFTTLELIRSAAVADVFREGVRTLTQQDKPVVITGFGTATWRGAGDVAPRSMEIVENDEHGRPIRLNDVYERDEPGQARYLTELLEIFEEEGVDGAFVYLFALRTHPHRPDGDPRDDLDLAGGGIVKVLEGRSGTTYPGLPWEPKAAFHAVAERYRIQD
ncbi:hypothetical protein AB0F91_14625 [Amycolatopsis sp. NPDC023774]|uniref:hypothetical protein n=1 Tax=Amycolatopsis sp. NPDC023774 TaxID=3155015 RepID=UPI0033F8850B